MRLEGEVRIPSGCAVAGIINKKGVRSSGDTITKMIATMRERSSGLGGGFAAYGIYPEYAEYYAFHIMYMSEKARECTEDILNTKFEIKENEPIKVRPVKTIKNEPLVKRYFLKPKDKDMNEFSSRELILKTSLYINQYIDGAYVMSGGKNMGVFKGLGYPEDIAEFFRLDEYKGYTWTVHGRFPTNTPGWWGGAHPFSILDLSVVHNGEISSYDANRRYLEMFDYKCTLQTDTEVLGYALDLLVRRRGFSMKEASEILAPPLWEEIDEMEKEEKDRLTNLRSTYGSLLMNGPFSIIVGFDNGVMALNDRMKLRPLTVGSKGNTTYFSSEEAAIITVCNLPEKIWYPRGGEPVIALLEEGEKIEKYADAI